MQKATYESIDVRKILYERSASFVLNMKEKNDELLHLLHEKDVIIRRLQNQLDVTKLYSQSTKKPFLCKCGDHLDLDNKIRQIQQKISCNKSGNFGTPSIQENGKNEKDRTLSWSPGLHEAESTLIEKEELEQENNTNRTKAHSSCYDIKEQYKSLSRDHLLSIIENLKNNQRYSPSSHPTSSRKSSPESDLERIELLCESPHEEIQQLHLHFLDMISEVDHLKNRIFHLQDNQEKTEIVLKNKNTNIDKLAQEIKNLKRQKPRSKSSRNRNNKSYSSTDLVTRVYSANNMGLEYPRYEREKRKNIEKVTNHKTRKSDRSTDSVSLSSTKKGKPSKKDVMTQVDKMDSPESVNQCIYVEKGSITITEKIMPTTTDTKEKDYEYEDEVFDECDEESVALN